MRRALVQLTALVLIAGGAWLLVDRSGGERPSPSPSPAEHEEHEEEEVSNIFVADVRTGRLERLTANSGEESFASAGAWAPRGRSLLYTQVPCDDCQPFVEVVDAAGGKEPARRVADGSFPAMLADGRRFVFLGRRGGIYLGALGRRATRQLASPSRTWDEPAPSPDGRRVLAVTQGSDGGARLALISVRGGPPRLLPDFGRSVANPVWSPDGRRIAFAALGRDGLWHIDTARPDGSARRQLLRGRSDTDPTWSPDGSRIAFVRTVAGSPAVFVAAADGTGARRLLADGIVANQPAWSPRGDRVAVTMKGDEVPKG